MVKPLRTEDPAPKNMQFAHFGVLNDGAQSKSSVFTSVTLNIAIACVAVILSAAAKHTMAKHKLESISLETHQKGLSQNRSSRQSFSLRFRRSPSSRPSLPRSRCLKSSSPIPQNRLRSR